jgi:tRNA pseudouridine55 synthase
MKGFINVNKPVGMTSSDVVVKVRGILKSVTGDKKIKVGHLGTLDPMASGVLPIAVGTAARLFPYLCEKSKTYIAAFTFGITSNTLDAEGELFKTTDVMPSAIDIDSVLADFTGEIAQMPPIFSAKSLDGKRAYQYARAGEEVKLSAKMVRIECFKRLSFEQAKIATYGAIENGVKGGIIEFAQGTEFFEITCGGGTYIRALARDLAAKLHTVAYMSALTRVSSGVFDLKNTCGFKEIQENAYNTLIPIGKVVNDMPEYELSAQGGVLSARVLNGVKTAFADLPAGLFRVYYENNLVGLALNNNGVLEFTVRL